MNKEFDEYQLAKLKEIHAASIAEAIRICIEAYKL